MKDCINQFVVCMTVCTVNDFIEITPKSYLNETIIIHKLLAVLLIRLLLLWTSEPVTFVSSLKVYARELFLRNIHKQSFIGERNM